MITLIPLIVVLPLAAGFLIPLAERVWTRSAEALAVLACLGSLVISMSLFGRQAVYHVGGWSTPLGIDLRVDGLTYLMLLAINGLALLVTAHSAPRMRRSDSPYRYYGLMMFVLAGTNGVALTGDLFNLYVFLEIAAIASYALVAYSGGSQDFEASFKYAVIGGLSSSLILTGIGLLYGMTGTLNMVDLAGRLVQPELGQSSSMAPVRFATALLFCGFAVKAAVVPFHTWLADAYPAAPAPISALLSGVVSKVTGLYVLARLMFNIVGVSDDMLWLMQWMGGITMVVGGFLALGQRDIKRLFAYSSISQVGLILLAFGFGTAWGIVGALYHLINHAVFKPLLFLGSGQVESAAGTRDLTAMNQLGRKIPITAATCMIGSLSLAGVPPFNGFWSKLIIVLAAIQSGHTGWAIVVVVMSIVALVYQWKAQTAAFYSAGQDRVDGQDRVEGAADTETDSTSETVLQSLPMIVLAAGCLLLSLLATSGLDNPLLIGPAAEVLVSGVWTP